MIFRTATTRDDDGPTACCETLILWSHHYYYQKPKRWNLLPKYDSIIVKDVAIKSEEE